MNKNIEIEMKIQEVERERDFKTKELVQKQIKDGILTSGIGKQPRQELKSYYESRILLLKQSLRQVDYDYDPINPTLTIYPPEGQEISLTFRSPMDKRKKSAQAILFEVGYVVWENTHENVEFTKEEIIKAANKLSKGKSLTDNWFRYTRKNLNKVIKNHPVCKYIEAFMEFSSVNKNKFRFSINIDKK